MRTTIEILALRTAITILILLTSEPVPAIDRYVDNSVGCGGNSPCYNTIQAAVDDAGTGDIINVANGTYTGGGNRNIDFKGKAITVQSDGGPANCIIDVEGTSNRGFIFQNSEGAGSVLTGFTITNANAFNGAGLYCDAASPTIANCHFIGNAAGYYGGGIYCESASPEISGCQLTGNTAVRQGGGIHCRSGSNPTITGCIIDTNSANGTGGGGLCSVDSAPTLYNSSISGNSAPSGSGGGIYGDNSPFSISFCDINENGASEKGGGIYCFFSAATINICTVANNTAAHGGGNGKKNIENSHDRIPAPRFLVSYCNGIHRALPRGHRKRCRHRRNRYKDHGRGVPASDLHRGMPDRS